MRKPGLMLCLIAILLTALTTPLMCEPLSTEEYESLLDEAAEVIGELLDENAGLLIELEDSWTSCATLVEETSTEAVSVAVQPLLIKLAGLEAERVLLRRRVILFGVAGLAAGLLGGIILGVIL